MGQSRGRPVKFKTVSEIQKKIDEYFEMCKGEIAADADGNPIFTKSGVPCWKKQPTPPTVTGLAFALGLTREGLLEYQKKDKFSDTITRAKQRVEMFCEESLFDRDRQRGAEFSLKNNFKGWNVEGEQRMQIQLLQLENQIRTNEAAEEIEDDAFIQAMQSATEEVWGDFNNDSKKEETENLP